MSTVAGDVTVADLVLEQPVRARVFERFGIDYCCGGKIPLAQACDDRGLELAAVVAALDEPLAPGPEDVDWRAASVGELVSHIVTEHHGYLQAELPSLSALVDKVARVHGGSHPELLDVQAVFEGLASELEMHMAKEEHVLFPACVALEEGAGAAFPFGTVRNPIAMMVHEHEEVADGLARLRELTNEFAPPQDGCGSYRAMLGRLETLDHDTRRHVHEENNILFPRAIALEPTAA